MPQATLLSLSRKVETITPEHGVWRDLGAPRNSRAADWVNRDEGWWGQRFPNPTTCSSLLLETWMLGCMFRFHYFLPVAEGGIELVRAVDTTSSVCPFVLSVLPAERPRDKRRQLTATIFLLTPRFFQPFLYAPSFQRIWVCLLQSICSNLRWHQIPGRGGSKRDPTAGLWLLPSNSIHQRAGGTLFLPALEEQMLISFACDSRNWIIGADLTRNARITKSQEFSR